MRKNVKTANERPAVFEQELYSILVLNFKLGRNSTKKVLDSLESFLGVFAKLRQAAISFVVSVFPFTWNNYLLTGRIFMKFGIYFPKISLEIQVSLNSGEGYYCFI